jgi:hypothetical protein
MLHEGWKQGKEDAIGSHSSGFLTTQNVNQSNAPSAEIPLGADFSLSQILDASYDVQGVTKSEITFTILVLCYVYTLLSQIKVSPRSM